MGAIVLAAIAVGLIILLTGGFDLVLVGLVAAFIVFGLLGFAIRLLPQSLPLLPSVSRILGFLALAALAGLMYLYVYPVVTNNPARVGTPSNPKRVTTQQATVVYSLTGIGGAEITAMSPLPNGDVAAQSIAALPYDHSVQLTVSKTNPGLFTMVARTVGSGDDSQLACTITIDGVVVAHEESSGAHGTVFCSGTPQ